MKISDELAALALQTALLGAIGLPKMVDHVTQSLIDASPSGTRISVNPALGGSSGAAIDPITISGKAIHLAFLPGVTTVLGKIKLN